MKQHTPHLILGAGPAGVQMAYQLHKRGEDYLILEQSDHPGAFFDKHPRHRKLLSINKCYTGYPDLESRRRYDWNALICDEERLQFPKFSKDYFPDADTIPEYLSEFVSHYGLEVKYNSRITKVSKTEEGFVVCVGDDTLYTCEQLFVGTGVSIENTPDIEGIEHCQTYEKMSIDPESYIDKRVMIIGKGNSAFETADALVESTRKIWVCGPSTVRLAWASHYVGDLRAVNNNFLDTYQLKAQNNILDGELRSVRKDEVTNSLVATVYFASRQRSYEYPCDEVLLCTGFRFDTSIFDADSKPEMRKCGRLPLMTSSWESTNTPGLYFIGTLMQSRDFRKTMSGFIHGFRHNIEALDHLLQQNKTGKWPAQIPQTGPSSTLAQTVVDRVSTSSAMMLQPGFLGDLVIASNGDSDLTYLKDIPVEQVKDDVLSKESRAYLITLEYKVQDSHMDPFNMPRGVKVDEDFYIHPIIRRFENGMETGKFYLPDDLDNDWRAEPEYLTELGSYFQREFSTNERRNETGQSFVAGLKTASQGSDAKEHVS